MGVVAVRVVGVSTGVDTSGALGPTVVTVGTMVVVTGRVANVVAIGVATLVEVRAGRKVVEPTFTGPPTRVTVWRPRAVSLTMALLAPAPPRRYLLLMF